VQKEPSSHIFLCQNENATKTQRMKEIGESGKGEGKENACSVEKNKNYSSFVE